MKLEDLVKDENQPEESCKFYSSDEVTLYIGDMEIKGFSEDLSFITIKKENK